MATLDQGGGGDDADHEDEQHQLLCGDEADQVGIDVPVAIGIDSRTRGFNAERLLASEAVAAVVVPTTRSG